jgi:imidazole glycerol-phosphate synthase subunit HisH
VTIGPRVSILDYGMGNLRSAEKALERVGARVARATDAATSREADGIVLPGVGAFPEAMRRLRAGGFDDLCREWVASGRPLLGICLGMQLLFGSSTENQGDEGLGLLEGTVTALDAPGLKVPHIGWEPVRWERPSRLAGDDPEPETPFYFVHSFAARPADAGDVAGSAEWGERFAAVVERGPVMGAQFHPEKSSGAGLRLLRNFVEACAPVAA